MREGTDVVCWHKEQVRRHIAQVFVSCFVLTLQAASTVLPKTGPGPKRRHLAALTAFGDNVTQSKCRQNRCRLADGALERQMLSLSPGLKIPICACEVLSVVLLLIPTGPSFLVPPACSPATANRRVARDWAGSRALAESD